MKKLRLKLNKIITDRTQYKPYVAELEGEDVYVEVTLDNNIKEEDGKLILTTDQLAAVFDKVATPIENMHDKHTREKYKI